MFGLTKKITPSSLISSSMTIKGKIESDSEIYVDGIVEGNINCKTLIVGINGNIKSPMIQVEKIVVHGVYKHFKGDLYIVEDVAEHS